MPAPITISLPPAPPAHALRQALLADRERALTRLYRQAFPAVRRLVQRQGGSAHDAQDVFQDALVVFYEQAVGGHSSSRPRPAPTWWALPATAGSMSCAAAPACPPKRCRMTTRI